MTEIVNDKVWRIVSERLRRFITLWSYYFIILLDLCYVLALTVSWFLMPR